MVAAAAPTEKDFREQLGSCWEEVLGNKLTSLIEEAVEKRDAGMQLEERRAVVEQQLGKNFVRQLRSADDWLLEGLLRWQGHEDDLECNKWGAYCAQAALMTHDCHGSLWPHLRFETQSYRKAIDMVIGIPARYPAAIDSLEAANKAVGVDPSSPPLQQREGLYLGDFNFADMKKLNMDQLVGDKRLALEGESASCLKSRMMLWQHTAKAKKLKGGPLAFVDVEVEDDPGEHLYIAMVDVREGFLVTLMFMHVETAALNSPKGSFEASMVERLRQMFKALDGAAASHVICTHAEMKDLLKELRGNSVSLSPDCYKQLAASSGFDVKEGAGSQAAEMRVRLSLLKVSYLEFSAIPLSLHTGRNLKNKANTLFREGNFEEALQVYGKALTELSGMRQFSECSSEERSEIAVVQSNMAECFLRQGLWSNAHSASSIAIELDPRGMKSFYRRARAHKEMGNLAQAEKDAETAAKIAPNDQSVTSLLQSLRCMRAAAAPARPPSTPAPSTGKGSFGSKGKIGAQGPLGKGKVGADPPSPAAWAVGLAPSKQQEWLVDCYRMRIDDKYVHGGGEVRGLYAAAGCHDVDDQEAILEDFLLFCKLAVEKSVIPPGWDWGSFLKVAKRLLPYAFEKSDAQEKYGQENIFTAMMGGRSLRYTGEIVFGSSIQDFEAGEDEEAMLEEIQELGLYDEELFEEVGGISAWQRAGLIPGSSGPRSRKKMKKKKGGRR